MLDRRHGLSVPLKKQVMNTDVHSQLPTSYNQLLAKLYDGVTASNGFQNFIEALVEIFGLKAVTLIIHHAETHEVKGLWLCGIKPEWVERYALDYAQEDLLADHIVERRS